MFWIGLALAHAVLLRDLDHGDGLLVDVLIATFIGDTGAYFGGRIWGTRRWRRAISPAQDGRGADRGFIAGTRGFWLAGLYQDWLSGAEALAIGACVAAAAPLGDLFESMIKRDLGVKDSGRFFGEHGGALDRLDAAFFTVIVGYYVRQRDSLSRHRAGRRAAVPRLDRHAQARDPRLDRLDRHAGARRRRAQRRARGRRPGGRSSWERLLAQAARASA